MERAMIVDVFATGLESVEHGGEYVRLTFVAERAAPGDDAQQIVVARLVMPHRAYHRVIKALSSEPMRLA